MIFLIYIADLKLIPVKVTVHSSCYGSGELSTSLSPVRGKAIGARKSSLFCVGPLVIVIHVMCCEALHKSPTSKTSVGLETLTKSWVGLLLLVLYC
jgi:hypothetical protein